MVLRGKILLSIAALGLASLAAQPKRVVIVVGDSMEPTYHNGELLVTKPLDRPLRHGDVIVVNTPEGVILKRVALLPGDFRTQWLRTTEWLDMTMFGKTHKRDTSSRQRKLFIPAGKVFLLGDNLMCSIDSRQFGPVSMENIRGLVLDSRPPAADSQITKPIPTEWIAEGIQSNRLLAHGNAKPTQPTNL